MREEEKQNSICQEFCKDLEAKNSLVHFYEDSLSRMLLDPTSLAMVGALGAGVAMMLWMVVESAGPKSSLPTTFSTLGRLKHSHHQSIDNSPYVHSLLAGASDNLSSQTLTDLAQGTSGSQHTHKTEKNQPKIQFITTSTEFPILKSTENHSRHLAHSLTALSRGGECKSQAETQKSPNLKIRAKKNR